MSDTELRKIFANSLNYYLSINGFSQADMARHMHVSTATVAQWCTGKTMPRIDKIQSLCNWFGIEKSSLLEEETHDPEEKYYMNAEARDMAEFLFKNPEYKVLFDASRKVKPEDIDFVKRMMDRMRGSDSGD